MTRTPLNLIRGLVHKRRLKAGSDHDTVDANANSSIIESVKNVGRKVLAAVDPRLILGQS